MAGKFVSPAPINNPIDGQSMITPQWAIWFSGLMNQVLALQKGNLIDIQDYANNAAAVAAGLQVGAIYRNGDYLMIVH